MSSYVISKEDYIKAAGIVAGIAEVKELWIFDYQKGRSMTTADYYDKFVEIFEMNAISVQEQYGDKEPEHDNNTYMKTWEKAYRKGKQFAYYENIEEPTLHLVDFFSSVVYQIEKPAYMWNVRSFFDRLAVQLFEKAHPHEVESWGSLEL